LFAPLRYDADRTQRELHALTEVAKTLTSARELPELLAAVMDKIIDVLAPAEVGAILLWDRSAGLFRPAAAFGLDEAELHPLGLRLGEGITGKVFDEGRARLLRSREEVGAAAADMRPANRRTLARALHSDEWPISAVGAVLQVGGSKLGVLELYTLRGRARFKPQDLPFVQSLADLIALAIDRYRLEHESATIHDAKQAERLRSEVMANLSHELRTALAAIKGYTTALLLDEVAWPEEKRSDFLRLVDEECDDMDAMIQEMMSSALIDAGQFSLEPQPLRLQSLAREVADQMQRRTEIHRLVIDFPPEIPLLDADPLRIKQVLRIILDNSIKYSPDGGMVVLRAEIRASDVLVSISDQGVGISPEDLIPLFEKYFRVRDPSGYHVTGTGLGLPVARAIIEAHGGRIWAESQLGQGTTLYFSLPRSGLSAFPEE
jgi:signal transduction histidine kinase